MTTYKAIVSSPQSHFAFLRRTLAAHDAKRRSQKKAQIKALPENLRAIVNALWMDNDLSVDVAAVGLTFKKSGGPTRFEVEVTVQ